MPGRTRHAGLHRLANHGPLRGLVGLANDFTPLQDDWIQITPLGDFPHSQGIQRVDAEAVRDMVNAFNAGLVGLANKFIGLPWYIGHPDFDRKTYPNDASYGRIQKLEARADGLYGLPKWGQAGKALIEDGQYGFFSPFWEGKQIGVENGKKIIRPTKLVSVGFTNQPNIPVLPLANEDLPVEELPNAGTSEGAKKGWETRRGASAAVAAKKIKGVKTAKKGVPAKPQSYQHGEYKRGGINNNDSVMDKHNARADSRPSKVIPDDEAKKHLATGTKLIAKPGGGAVAIGANGQTIHLAPAGHVDWKATAKAHPVGFKLRR